MLHHQNTFPQEIFFLPYKLNYPKKYMQIGKKYSLRRKNASTSRK